MGDDRPTDEELDRLQWTTVLYDLHETNPDNGLVRDKTDPAAPSSIAANGLGAKAVGAMPNRGPDPRRVRRPDRAAPRRAGVCKESYHTEHER